MFYCGNEIYDLYLVSCYLNLNISRDSPFLSSANPARHDIISIVISSPSGQKGFILKFLIALFCRAWFIVCKVLCIQCDVSLIYELLSGRLIRGKYISRQEEARLSVNQQVISEMWWCSYWLSLQTQPRAIINKMKSFTWSINQCLTTDCLQCHWGRNLAILPPFLLWP